MTDLDFIVVTGMSVFGATVSHETDMDRYIEEVADMAIKAWEGAMISLIVLAVCLAGMFFWKGYALHRRTKIRKRLSVWFDDWTWVVAKDHRDALALLCDHYEGQPPSGVRQLKASEPLTLWIGHPEGPTVTKTADEWANIGRGFLASTEY